VFRSLDLFVGGFLHLAKSIFKKYWSTDLYFLQDRKTKMNLKKGQLVAGLGLKTDMYFELKRVLLTRCRV